MQYHHSIGLYPATQFHKPAMYIGYIMDDFGNLVGITDDQFDQSIYHYTGVMY